ncbi:MAG: SprT-like domain-containing protein [Candidatus Pacearchaeota archaeon]
MILRYSHLAKEYGDLINIQTFDLNVFFDEMNAKYFNNTVPKVPVGIARSSKQLGIARASVWWKIRNVSIEKMTPKEIEISKNYKFDLELLTRIMVHEMIHILLFSREIWKDTGDRGGHGSNFKAEIQRIKGLGLNVPLSEELNTEALEHNLKKVSERLVFLRKRMDNTCSIVVLDKNYGSQFPDLRYFAKTFLFAEDWIELNIGYSTHPDLAPYPKVRTTKGLKMFKITLEEYEKFKASLIDGQVFNK